MSPPSLYSGISKGFGLHDVSINDSFNQFKNTGYEKSGLKHSDWTECPTECLTGLHYIQVIYYLKVYCRFYHKRRLTQRHHTHQARKSQLPKIIPYLFGVSTFLGSSQYGETGDLFCQAIFMVHITNVQYNINRPSVLLT